MFNVAKFANGRAETRTHGWQSLKFLLFLICPIVASLSLQGVCVGGGAHGEKESGERAKERKNELRVKSLWALSAVKTTLSFEE